MLERQIGKPVSGILRDCSASWSLGRTVWPGHFLIRQASCRDPAPLA
ncbi:hypothetical protein AB2M62_03245 [Sphingomonas sp. MMS12-HWE2-04]